MSAEYKVDKEKCISCGVCISICPDGIEWDSNDKSKIKDSKKVAECGGESICPYGAIEKAKQ